MPDGRLSPGEGGAHVGPPVGRAHAALARDWAGRCLRQAWRRWGWRSTRRVPHHTVAGVLAGVQGVLVTCVHVAKEHVGQAKRCFEGCPTPARLLDTLGRVLYELSGVCRVVADARNASMAVCWTAHSIRRNHF